MEEYPVQKFLVPLLKHFGPGLERLGLSSPTDGDLDQLQQVCAENCRGLQHLATSYQEDLRGDLRKDMTISSIIRFFKRPGLKSLSMDGYLYLHDTKAILDALVDCHSQTVEQVDMLDCGSSLDVLKRLFVECKKLKRLWVMDRPTGSVDNQVRYYFQDNVNNYFIGPTWQCLEMRELCVHLNSYQNGHGRVVGQIGRMIKLETLGIGYNDPNLLPIPKRDRGPGCLAELRQLKNLKQLRHLFLMSEFWHSMGQAEVEFMIQHWPNLEKITFGFFPETLQEIRREPHWQWLKRNKPHIQYTWWSDHHNYIAQQL
ncbi:hypothetical protein BGX34_003908 [Mortierella sp. NVP85]|nr:hypothetical protein BGX34_003908 [Mortierella sp. NVP85]